MKRIGLIILFCLFFIPANTQAVSVSPVRTVITVDPGESNTVSIKVANNTDAERNYELRTLSFSESEQGQVIYGYGVQEAEKWLKPRQEKIVLKVNESKTIDFLVKIPSGVPAGSYYLALAAKELGKESGNLGVGAEVASLLILQVAGEVKEELVVKEINSERSIYFSKPWKLELSLKNLTPVEVPVKGRVYLKDPMGELVAAKDLALGRDILARSERRIQTVLWENASLVLPGKYRVSIIIDYGKTNGQIAQEVFVWYFPIWFVVAGPIVIILLVSLTILKKRNKKNA